MLILQHLEINYDDQEFVNNNPAIFFQIDSLLKDNWHFYKDKSINCFNLSFKNVNIKTTDLNTYQKHYAIINQLKRWGFYFDQIDYDLDQNCLRIYQEQSNQKSLINYDFKNFKIKTLEDLNAFCLLVYMLVAKQQIHPSQSNDQYLWFYYLNQTDSNWKRKSFKIIACDEQFIIEQDNQSIGFNLQAISSNQFVHQNNDETFINCFLNWYKKCQNIISNNYEKLLTLDLEKIELLNLWTLDWHLHSQNYFADYLVNFKNGSYCLTKENIKIYFKDWRLIKQPLVDKVNLVLKILNKCIDDLVIKLEEDVISYSIKYKNFEQGYYEKVIMKNAIISDRLKINNVLMKLNFNLITKRQIKQIFKNIAWLIKYVKDYVIYRLIKDQTFIKRRSAMIRFKQFCGRTRYNFRPYEYVRYRTYNLYNNWYDCYKDVSEFQYLTTLKHHLNGLKIDPNCVQLITHPCWVEHKNDCHHKPDWNNEHFHTTKNLTYESKKIKKHIKAIEKLTSSL